MQNVKKKTLSATILTLLIMNTVVLTFGIRTVNAQGTIYIRSDGSVDPSTAPISRAGNVYTFTANIYEPIVIERNNIIVDGKGYMLQGAPPSYGFTLTSRSNVTIKNTYITGFRYGIFGKFSTDCTMDRNAFRNNDRGGVWLESSTRNNIANNAMANNYVGVLLTWSNNTNTITNNSIRNNPFGIMFIVSSGNTIKDNTIANSNLGGVYLDRANNTLIYHNNLINNTPQAVTSDSINTWDNGYPSGGNYWSDYSGVDLKRGPNQDQSGSDGIGDTPYIIDTNNRDRYPLMSIRGTHDMAVTNVAISKTVIGQGYSATINVTVQNQGSLTQVFDVTVYANTSIIQTLSIYLTSGSSTTRTITWSTTGWTKGAYTLKVFVTIVPGETDTADNTFTYGIVKVTVPGDTDGDRDIDIYDIVKIASAYGAKRGEARFNPNCDIDSNDVINIYDVVIATSRYGYKE
jgi:parallel beta-helix repeat protein